MVDWAFVQCLTILFLKFNQTPFRVVVVIGRIKIFQFVMDGRDLPRTLVQQFALMIKVLRTVDKACEYNECRKHDRACQQDLRLKGLKRDNVGQKRQRDDEQGKQGN